MSDDRQPQQVVSPQRHGIRSHGTVSGHQNQRSGVEASSATTSASSEQPGAPVYDEQTRWTALVALRRAGALPDATDAEKAAAKAIDDLVSRERVAPAQYRDLTRDEARALKRYQRIVDDRMDSLVSVARSKGLLTIETKEQH